LRAKGNRRGGADERKTALSEEKTGKKSALQQPAIEESMNKGTVGREEIPTSIDK